MNPADDLLMRTVFLNRSNHMTDVFRITLKEVGDLRGQCHLSGSADCRRKRLRVARNLKHYFDELLKSGREDYVSVSPKIAEPIPQLFAITSEAEGAKLYTRLW